MLNQIKIYGMKLFLNKAERRCLLGFDDHRVALIGIPLLAWVAYLLFKPAFPVEVTQTWSGVLTCYFVGLVHTSIYWLIMRAILIGLRQRLPRLEQTGRRIGWLLLGALVGVLTVELFAMSFIDPFLRDGESGFISPPLLFTVAACMLLSVMVLAMYESVYFFVRYRQSLVEQERLAKANMQAQLAALKQQTNPHFLFNSLNTLADLIPEDPRLATQFVQRLSAVYRRILEYRHQELIDLGTELEALRDYVFLMQVRFQGKLRVELEVEPAYHRALVVPLSLQLLVENAIKHNVVSARQPLHVRVKASEDRIEVRNDYRPRERGDESTGIGQQNIRRRYELLGYSQVMMAVSDDSYTVRLPLIWESAEAYA